MVFYKINEELTIDKNNISEIVSRPNNTVDICMKNGNCYNCHETFEHIWDKLNNNEQNKKWQPQEQESYYYINSLGQIWGEIYAEAHEDLWRKMNGNCFPTREQADQYLENLKTKAELKALADELNGDEVIDWEDCNQDKYYLTYNGKDNHISCSLAEVCMISGNIYCLSEYFISKAIDRIGEQRLINMIKAGV
jgi:uncharacterized protein YlzI (FlbEa/FlbD family)